MGVAFPHFGLNTHLLGAMEEAVSVGDCKSDLEICIWLGRRLNPDAWPWETPEEFLTDALKPFDLTFEDLQERVSVQQEFHYRKYELGLLRPDGEPGFNTATGLIELKSTIYPNFDEDGPFSYTHLDVYKRQWQSRACGPDASRRTNCR